MVTVIAESFRERSMHLIRIRRHDRWRKLICGSCLHCSLLRSFAHNAAFFGACLQPEYVLFEKPQSSHVKRKNVAEETVFLRRVNTNRGRIKTKSLLFRMKIDASL